MKRQRVTLVAAVMSTTAFALPHYGDPNQGYDRIPGTRATPHVAWAKPLAGGKLKTLIILPYNMSRNVVEIGQRLDIAPTWIMTAGRSIRTQAYREGSIATPLFDREADLVLEKIMKERLLDRSKKYDVIVIGKVSWDVFEKTEQDEIVRRVKEDGTGLVYFGPNRVVREENKVGQIGRGNKELTSPDPLFDAFAGTYDAAAQAEILKGVPVDALPVVFGESRDKLRGDFLDADRMRLAEAGGWIGSAKLGKGRVVTVDYADAQVRSPWQDAMAFIYKLPNGWFDWTVYDYAYEIAARAVLVATGRGESLKATVAIAAPRFAPRLEWDMKLASNPVESGVWSNPPPREAVIKHPAKTVWRDDLSKCVLKAENAAAGAMTLRDRDGKTILSKEGVTSLVPPALKRGDYFACYQAKDAQGGVTDFASAAFRVETDVKVVDLKTKSKRYDPGETIAGEFKLTRALMADETVEATAHDLWGRLVYRGAPEIAGQVGAFRIPVKAPLSRMWDLYVTVKDKDGDVADAACWVGVPDWDFDDYYAMLIFAPRPGQLGWKGELNSDLMGENGINASYSEYIYSRPDYSEHDARKHFVTWAYTDHHGELHNQPELVKLGIANTNLDIQALNEMMDAYVANGGQRLNEKDFPYRQHAMHVPLFNQQLDYYGYANNFGVMSFAVTGENYLSGEFGGGGGIGMENSGFGPKTTRAFQEWCKKEYQNDLAALNREWNTSFKEWHEVKGLMLQDAVMDDQLPRWVDFRFFMRSEMWSGFFCKLDDYIHTRAPKVKAGFGGHAQHDFTKYRGPKMTSGKLYVSQKDNWEWLDAFECEIRQSFSGDEGYWLGSQSSIRWTSDLNNEISRKRIAWAMLLMGMRGFDFENGVAGDSFGGMAWTTPDFSELLPYTKEVLGEVNMLQRGLARLVFKGKPWRSPVALYWSPRNHYISRLLPGQQPRGFSGGWLYNVSLIDGAPNDALGMMNSLRIRPTVVGPQDIGDLAKRGFKAVWLPYNKGMSEAEAAAIEAFVKDGGLVLADNEPATYTQHGKKREARLLKNLFPDFSKLTVTKVGKGHAVYLEGRLNGYPDRMLEGNFKGADAVARFLEEYAGVVAPVTITDDKELPVRDVRFAEYGNGGTRVVLFLRQHVGEMENDMKEYRLDFGGEYDVYDITKNSEHLGRHAYLELGIDHYAKCLALVPAKVKSAAIDCDEKIKPGEDLALKLQISFSKSPLLNFSGPIMDCWHVNVFSPDGAELKCYRKNHVSKGDTLKLSLPIALDAAKGKYRIVMTSAVSGVKAETQFEVKL
ncbi:MAG TPA: beta-galactosidase [Opitutales bacterium]|nr:beta-galactosidase [Opitutales bacterium]